MITMRTYKTTTITTTAGKIRPTSKKREKYFTRKTSVLIIRVMFIAQQY